MDWPSKITYPNIVPKHIGALLDLLEELIDMPIIEDRYSWVSELINRGRKTGLITGDEYFWIRAAIGEAI